MQILQNLSPTVFDSLCGSTNISTSLLTNLRIHKVITAELCAQIERQCDPKSKAEDLYTFLKNYRTDADLPKLMKALEDSAITQAIEILNQATEGEVQILPTSGSLITTNLIAKTSRELEICLDNAQPGCIINLEDGVYVGPFVVKNDGVQIVGRGAGTVLRADDTADCLTISGSGCTICNVKIIRSNTGIVIEGSKNTIKQVELADMKLGIEIRGSQNTLDKMSMTSLSERGLGIDSDGNTISNITGLDVKCGIAVIGSKNDFVSLNFQRGTRGRSFKGVLLGPGSSHNRISKLTCIGYSIEEGDLGLMSLWDSSNCSVVDSVCGPVVVQGSDDLTLTNVDCGEYIAVEGDEGLELINCRGKMLKVSKTGPKTIKLIDCVFQEID